MPFKVLTASLPLEKKKKKNCPTRHAFMHESCKHCGKKKGGGARKCPCEERRGLEKGVHHSSWKKKFHPNRLFAQKDHKSHFHILSLCVLGRRPIGSTASPASQSSFHYKNHLPACLRFFFNPPPASPLFFCASKQFLQTTPHISTSLAKKNK